MAKHENKNSEGLSVTVDKLKSQGIDAKQTDLMTETVKTKARRKRLKDKLKSVGLGDPSRDKTRNMVE